MGQKTDTIHIKWVRSGIALPRQQRKIVASLGLSRLHQVVARPDTPNIRGVVAKVPHLLQVVSAPVAPPWRSVPEYVIAAPAALTKPPKAKAEPKAAKEASEEAAVPVPAAEANAAKAEGSAPRKKAEEAKKATAAPAKRASAKSEGEKPRKRKTADDKESKSAKKGKK